MMAGAHSHSSLIPVLVTGIQPRRVCAVNNSSASKDLAALDSCDRHRNEGVESISTLRNGGES